VARRLYREGHKERADKAKLKKLEEKKMKNLKNILATLVLVTVMGVSSSLAGVFVTDRANTDTRTQGCKANPTLSTGIMIGTEGIMIGLEGIMIGLEGLLMSDRANVPCSAATEGIMIG
jgi:hypothetical protein